MTEQQDRIETELVVITDEDELEPQSLEYDDEDRGANDEPVSEQKEPDDLEEQRENDTYARGYEGQS